MFLYVLCMFFYMIDMSVYRSEGVVAERRIFFLGALPGRSGRLPPFLRTYVRTSVRAAGRAQPLGVAAAWCPSRPIQIIQIPR